MECGSVEGRIGGDVEMEMKKKKDGTSMHCASYGSQ